MFVLAQDSTEAVVSSHIEAGAAPRAWAGIGQHVGGRSDHSATSAFDAFRS
jgi:hypothetical protein